MVKLPVPNVPALTADAAMPVSPVPDPEKDAAVTAPVTLSVLLMVTAPVAANVPLTVTALVAANA